MIEALGTYAGTYYYHFDALGSVVALTDGDANTVEVYEYDVYGRVGATDANHPNRFMFTGRELDKETGLYYYRARYYNAEIGRFLQTDPVGYGAGMNLYRYCRNNPVGSVDPSGSEDVSLGGELPSSPYYEPTGEIMVCDYRFDPTSIDAMNKWIKGDKIVDKICDIKDAVTVAKVILDIVAGRLPEAKALTAPASAFAGISGEIMDRLINNIMDSCNVQLYKAYIKVQGYKRSSNLIRLGVGLIWPEAAWVKDGPAKWVEVHGGEGWDDYAGITGYTEASDAYNAAAAALADTSQFRYRPKKQ
jgi:RHS repeat-associated protein